MSLSTLAFLAILPIIATAVLLVGLRMPARRAMPMAFILTVLIAWGAWDLSIIDIAASSLLFSELFSC